MIEVEVRGRLTKESCAKLKAFLEEKGHSLL